MNIEFNLFDPQEVDEQEPKLREMRSRCPVSQVLPGVYYLARHADVVETSRASELFVPGSFRPMNEEDPRTPDQLNLGETHPPEHMKVRRVLASALAPRKMREFDGFIKQVCDELVDAFADKGEADLIADLGGPLPAIVIGHIAGIPEEIRPDLRGYSDDYIAQDSHPDLDEQAAAIERVQRFDDRMREVIAVRQAMTDRPRDVMTALIEAVDAEGRPLSDERILTHLTKDIIIGGIETTTHMIGNLFHELLTTPGAYETVRDDRDLVPVAVEEALRRRAPVQVLFRQPTEDVRVGEVDIPAGAIVSLGYASANLDERVFEDPETFRLDRGKSVNDHLGFGIGAHACVGATLARLELMNALSAVLDRIPSMTLAPDFEYERVRFFMMQGPVRMDVRFPAQAS